MRPLRAQGARHRDRAPLPPRALRHADRCDGRARRLQRLRAQVRRPASGRAAGVALSSRHASPCRARRPAQPGSMACSNAPLALRIGSVSLFADSVDFFEDTSVNLVIFLALSAESMRARALSRHGAGGNFLAGSAAAAALWTAASKFHQPDAARSLISLSSHGSRRLAVNLTCAVIAREVHPAHRGSLTRAAFLSARNDAYANLAIIGAGLVTAMLWSSIWPDLIVEIWCRCRLAQCRCCSGGLGGGA